MEQQTVSVAKAGVLCTLPARTCILAAANPSGGHYDKSRTVTDNLKICPTLLSRFDLVFILLDHADSHLDQLLTNHIQALHTSRVRPGASNRNDGTQQFVHRNHGSERREHPANASLYERLKLDDASGFVPISHDLMHKYIGYARKYCHPVLTPEATDQIKRFYLELRTANNEAGSIAVTTRQLEALIRLTQARARVELSGVATLQHVQDVLAIFQYSRVQALATDEDVVRMRRRMTGGAVSVATQTRKYLQMLQQERKSIFTYEELEQLAECSGFVQSLTNVIDSLNVQGFLIKKGRDVYKFIT